MKKFISTKMKVFISFLIVISVGCYIAAAVTLYNSDYKLSNYVNEWKFHDFRVGWNFDWDYYISSGVIEKDLPSTIENIILKSTSSDLSFEFYNEDKLKIEVSGDFDGGYEYTDGVRNISINNNEVFIEANESYKVRGLKIKLFIPSRYKGNISLTSTSGEIRGTGGDLNKINISTQSGDIETNNLTANILEFTSTSGEIYASNLKSSNSQIKSSSGDIDILGNTGDASINTTSGKVEINISELNKNLNISTSSGDVSLQIPPNANYKLGYTTSSGDLKGSVGNINIESGRTYSITNGDGSNSINVNTTSGDLDIN